MDLLHFIEKSIDACFACWPRQRPKNMNMQLAAHRGAHDKALGIQENTDAAFKRALDLGCDGIEFDVQTTADGVLVVNHDSTLNRLWGHDVAIHQLTFSELRSLVPTLPSLAEVVHHYGKKMHLFIEIKAPFKAFHALEDTLKELTPCIDYHLLSLDEALLPSLQAFPKAALLLVPGHNNVNKFCRLSLQHQYGGVLGHYLLLNNRQINNLRSANQLVGVGFIDSKFSLYRELNRGLSLIFTNNATKITSYL